MDFPLNLFIFGYEIDSHLIFEVLGYSLGFRYYQFLRKKTDDPISSEDRLWIFIGAVIGAYFLSRFLGLMENFQALKSENLKVLLGNRTIVGGLLGGLIGVELTKKILKVKSSSGDLMVYPIIFGMILGRIGCFLSGIKDFTYGIASNLPWAMDLGDGIKRHPTNLYEISFLLVLWILIKKLEYKFIFKDGVKFKIFLSAYLLFRFLVEYIKPINSLIFNISSIQIACLIGIIYYVKKLFFDGKILERKI